ncbi:unnamed protein product [Allacma fusca]|uniref:Endonuclease III homolog n=1 Tax=Allacma fusca TaxID=39272 RepID=A0A8J2P7Y8_9HEXA|nr:unnamed protein product [Allacma fusca]
MKRSRTLGDKQTARSSKAEEDAGNSSEAGNTSGGPDGAGADMGEAKWEPPNWETVLENIKQMRIGKDAPVDTMGCERTMEDNVAPKVRRFQTLLSLMLSSQTKDPVTYAAMERLKSGRSLTIDKILDMSEEELGKTIIPVGFWKKKSIYIQKTSQILRDKYNDDIPDTIEGLCSLPGVGPKMAYIAMNVAWEKNAGIGVDTHVHRISNRLGWTGKKETKNPEATRKALESWLPSEVWQEFNILLVGFGQTVCVPLKPKCSSCLNNQLCPFGKAELRSRKGSTKKSKKSKFPKEEESSDDVDEISKYF